MDNHFQRHWLLSWIHGCRVLHSACINSFSLPGRGKIQIAGWEREWELVIFSIKIIVQCFGVSFVFAWQKKKKRCGPANKFWHKNSQSLCSQTSMGNSWIFTLSSRNSTISVKHVLLKKRGALISFQSEISSLLRDHETFDKETGSGPKRE